MLDRYARFVTRHAGLVLAGVAIASALAFAAVVDVRALAEGRYGEALRLVIDPAQDSLLPTDDEGRHFYDRIRRIFGNDETLLLVAKGKDGVWTPAFLDALARATDELDAADGIRSVTSLSNAPNVRALDGDLMIAPFYEEIPTSDAEIARIQRDLEENPILAGSLVSQDGSAAVIVLYLLDMSEVEFTSQEIDLKVKAIADEQFAGEAEVLLTGGARVKAETSRMLASDLMFVVPLAALLLAGIAFLSFRTPRGVMLPMVSVGLSVLWTLGFAAVIDPYLNLVTITVPALILVVGFAYTVHVVSAYYEELEATGPDAPGDSAALRALSAIILPTLLTGLTTAAGFLSLATSPIRAIQLFGIYCGIGVACSMVATLTFSPAVLQVLKERAPRKREHKEGGDAIERMLGWLGVFAVDHRVAILGTGAIIAVIALIGIPRIQIGTNMVESFPADTEVRQSIERVNELAGASDQIYLVVEAQYKDAFKEPANLAALAELQTWLAEQPEVGGTTSLVDQLKLINRGFHDNDPEYYAIPSTKRLVSQLIFFGASDETKRVVDSQYQLASIAVRINVHDSADMVTFFDRIEDRLDSLPERLSARVTGNSVLMARTADAIALGQALSLSSAFVIIFIILSLLFTSVRVGFLALIPNALPVLIYFGTLGWTGVSLNVTTGLVASLVLGIAVDDTIHFLARFNAFAKEKADEKEGVRLALIQVGRPVTYTSAALVSGFGIVGLSQLQQTSDFGFLAAFTLGVAWVVDLTFTPALAAGMRIVTLWDALTLDLGEDPGAAIPLFHGMSPAQARIAALMTEVDEFDAGHRLMTLGEKGDDGMYVIIEGALVSSVEHEGETVTLNRHVRGDVIGEVGLFRGERTANVDCESDVRLLRLDESNLARLRRRYPRIGSPGLPQPLGDPGEPAHGCDGAHPLVPRRRASASPATARIR